MCVAPFDADFGMTQIAGCRSHQDGTHVVIYGNEPVNKHYGPNAIILHVPVHPDAPFGQDNFLPTDGLERLLDDMWAAVPKVVSKSMSFGFKGVRGSVTVFQRGMYFWVVARQATPEMVLAALELVPEHVRPQISAGLIAWYQRTWPYDALAIGCFSSASGQKAEPVAMRYVPQDWNLLRLPAVDAHGTLPVLGEYVDVRHRLIVGTDEFGFGGEVRYSEGHQIHPLLARSLPRLVVGIELKGMPMRNGDFYVNFGQLQLAPNDGGLVRAHGRDLTAGGDNLPVLLDY